MARPTKFTAEVRGKIIDALTIGASRRTAAAIAGVDESQIRRWMARGREADPDSSFREFHDAVIAAEAHPRMRALGVIYKRLPDDPTLAWKFIERREPGYAPPMPSAPAAPTGPVIIQLSLSDGRPLEVAETVIEVQPIESHDEPPGLPGTGTTP